MVSEIHSELSATNYNMPQTPVVIIQTYKYQRTFVHDGYICDFGTLQQEFLSTCHILSNSFTSESTIGNKGIVNEV